MRLPLICVSLGLLGLGACEPTPTPDYTIRVMPGQNGNMVAIPPTCPSWATDTRNPFDNQPDPQFGCANARNLALTVENPQDLVQARTLSDTRGVTMVGAMRRYDNNQTRGLIYTSSSPDSAVDPTTANTATSGLTGDVTGSANSSSSSSSGASNPLTSSTSSSSSASGP